MMVLERNKLDFVFLLFVEGQIEKTKDGAREK